MTIILWKNPRAFILLILVSILFPVVYTAIPTSQVNALQDLYHTTNGPYWFVKNSWLNGDPCDWYGIKCNTARTGVTGLYLGSNNVSGPFPNFLSCIPTLTQVDLGANDIRGFMTQSFFDPLTVLYDFDISSNQINGIFPSSICNTNLNTLNIAHNGFSGDFPTSCDHWMNQVLTLFLTDNMFTNNILDFRNMISIVSFQASINNFHGEIDSIQWSSFPNLSQLDLSRNPQLSMSIEGPQLGVFSELPSLQLLSLAEVDLSHSYLSQIDWGSPIATPFTQIFLDNAQLHGTLPDNIGDTISIIGFSAHSNHLTGSLPQSIKQWTYASLFDVHENKLTGLVPDISMPDAIVDLSDNNWQCPVPHGPFYSTAVCSCPPGYSGVQDTVCTKCGPGKVSAVVFGGSVCETCPKNTYSPHSANSQCIACPTLMYSNPGSSECSAWVVLAVILPGILVLVGCATFCYSRKLKSRLEKAWNDRMTSSWTTKMMGFYSNGYQPFPADHSSTSLLNNSDHQYEESPDPINPRHDSFSPATYSNAGYYQHGQTIHTPKEGLAEFFEGHNENIYEPSPMSLENESYFSHQ